jgi:hypothetical protein
MADSSEIKPFSAFAIDLSPATTTFLSQLMLAQAQVLSSS